MKDELKNMFTAYWDYLAISSACQLNLFDAIEQGAKTPEELQGRYSLTNVGLKALLEICARQGLITQDSGLSLTNKGEYLTENHPESLKYACLYWAQEPLTAWQDLAYSLNTGNSSFENIYGQSYFDYLSKNPKRLVAYHKAMNEYARDDYRSICSVIDFSQHSTIMDVGGGFGALIQNIKSCNPDLTCILFDRPEVVQHGIPKDVEVIGGNFFEPLPISTDAVILSRVIHDWEDSQAEIILRNVFQSLPVNGTLYLIENLPERMENHASSLTLNMLVLCKSYERTLEQYQTLLFQGGFRFKSVVQLNSTQYILIATK